MPTAPHVPARQVLQALAYDTVPARYYQPTYRILAEALAPATGALLDVGCGPGWLSIHAGAGKPQLDVIGIDTNPAMVARAERNKGSRLNVTFRELDARHVVYPDQTFDVAVALQSAHHWAEPAAVLAEVHRVMVGGGAFYIYEADSDATEVPAGWVERRGPWPPDAFVLRAGYGYRPTAIAPQTGFSSFVDSDAHILGAGGAVSAPDPLEIDENPVTLELGAQLILLSSQEVQKPAGSPVSGFGASGSLLTLSLTVRHDF